MAKKSVKQIISDAKYNLKNVSNKTKVKIGAGLMAGSMLFRGLIGCAPTRVNNSKDELETKGSETVEKAEVESNPVLDQTLEAQLASVTNRLEQILRAQGVSEQAIADLRKKVDGCVTPSQMQGAINSMKDQIEAHVSKEIDEKLSSMEGTIKQPEQQPEQKPESGEIKFGGEIDLDEMLSILQQMSFDIEVGNRTDYHKMFIEAERFDAILKSTDNELDERKLDDVEWEITNVQRMTLYLIVKQAIEVEQGQTGCVRIDAKEHDAKGFVAIDTVGRRSVVMTDSSVLAGIIQGDKALYYTGTEVYEESMDEEKQDYIYGSEYIADVMVDIMSTDSYTDFSYDILNGYIIYTPYFAENSFQDSNGKEYKVISQKRQIKFDENGGIDNVKVFETRQEQPENEEVGIQTGLIQIQTTKTSEYEIVSISEKEMDNLEKKAVSMIESARQETDTSEQ